MSCHVMSCQSAATAWPLHPEHDWLHLQVLAEQHMMKLEQVMQAMPPGLRPGVAVLTGSAKAKERKAVYAGLADGSIGIIVGTHALITDSLEFKKLGLAVIDEQHR